MERRALKFNSRFHEVQTAASETVSNQELHRADADERLQEVAQVVHGSGGAIECGEPPK